MSILKKGGVLLFWILIWQLAAVLIHNDILLASPVQTGRALIALLPQETFARSVASSLLRIFLGFTAGAALGTTLGALSFRSPLIRTLLTPLIQVMKAIPVASFVILILIWIGSRNVSLVIAMLVVLPVLYLNTLHGLSATDTDLLEMAQVFRLSAAERVRAIYLPQLLPFLDSAMELALGMSFKSGVAAEVIGQPLYSIGNAMYRSKINLDTADLFAWTVTVIVLAFVFEKLLLRLIRAALKRYTGAV